MWEEAAGVGFDLNIKEMFGMDSGKKLLVSALFALLLPACGSENKSQAVSVTSEQVSLVSGGFMNGDEPGVSIYIGPDEFNFFEITLDRINVKSGYAVKDMGNSVANFSVAANWGGEHYVQSSHHATYTTFQIRSLSPDEAVIELSAKLLSMSSGKFLVLAPSLVHIRGELLQKLTAPQ
ncbi:hypothetical protein ACYZTX_29190 [Pseudomonas sp. MDT1-17]